MITCITWATASVCLITLWIWLSKPYDRGFADGVQAERRRRLIVQRFVRADRSQHHDGPR